MLRPDMDTLNSILSGSGTWALMAVFAVVAWAIRSHYSRKAEIAELRGKVAALEAWKASHDSETGVIARELHDFRMESADRLARIETKIDNNNGKHR